MKAALICLLVSTIWITSCVGSSGTRTFSRSGLELQVPSDWIDSHGREESKQFGFRDASGQIGFGVEKLPGQWDEYLSYERKSRAAGYKEEEIQKFGRFAGNGYRFLSTDKKDYSEAVFFAPSGELEGWFMIVSSNSKDSRLQDELLAVVNSLQKAK